MTPTPHEQQIQEAARDMDRSIRDMERHGEEVQHEIDDSRRELDEMRRTTGVRDTAGDWHGEEDEAGGDDPEGARRSVRVERDDEAGRGSGRRG